MPYEPKNWSDGPEGGTPITEAELDRMETQYAEAVADAAADAAGKYEPIGLSDETKTALGGTFEPAGLSEETQAALDDAYDRAGAAAAAAAASDPKGSAAAAAAASDPKGSAAAAAAASEPKGLSPATQTAIDAKISAILRLDPAAEETFSRHMGNSNAATISQRLALSMFTARTTMTRTTIAVPTALSAMTADPTLARIGIYELAANGSMTLLGATPSDITLFRAANTLYTRTLTPSVALKAGTTYAVGVLIVGTTVPTFVGAGPAYAVAAISPLPPVVGGFFANQTDLAPTLPVAPFGNQPFYARIT